MNMSVTLPIILSQLLQQATLHGTCSPNTTIYYNGNICSCNSTGRWNTANCIAFSRRSMCQPGQMTEHDCQKCVCQQNGQLSCITVCSTTQPVNTTLSTTTRTIQRSAPDPLNEYPKQLRCSSYHLYYVDCKICSCPASGRTSEAQCVLDVSCDMRSSLTLDKVMSKRKQACIPNVIYVFQCLHCICTSRGVFDKKKCIRWCKKSKHTDIGVIPCNPQTIFRVGTSVCFCPDEGFHKDMFCTNKSPTGKLVLLNLNNLLNSYGKCTPNSFTKTRCIYCDCNSNGTINENACHVHECLSISGLDFGDSKTCTPGTLVPLCVECFCHGFGVIDVKFCTKTCSYKSKINVLNNMLKEAQHNRNLIDLTNLMILSENDECIPNTVYLDQEDLCLCPYNGKTNYKICTFNFDDTELSSTRDFFNTAQPLNIEFSLRCEPSSFITFDCNTCFCSKQGTVDPMWCTYDDCQAKRSILESHRHKHSKKQITESTCVPGTLFMHECNYCLCKDSGLVEDSTCTKGKCAKNTTITPDFISFSCEPLAYYEVDCNVCLCPIEGVTNIEACTKNLCENSFLRNDVCNPGQLFINECDICVCPPSGHTADRICKKQTCDDPATATWKNIFKHSDVLLRNFPSDTTRYIDLCFPGEQFAIGCKLCLCPEMGLRSYATCTTLLCDDSLIRDTWTVMLSSKEVQDSVMSLLIQLNLQQSGEMTMTDSEAPNSLYRDGISGNNFFLIGRRNKDRVNSAKSRTEYRCESPGRIMDKCFLCNCDDHNTIVVEHCLKSEDTECVDAQPTFLNRSNTLLGV